MKRDLEAQPSASDLRKAREAGFDSHFTKPLSPEVLQDLLVTIADRLESGRDAVSTPRTRLIEYSLATLILFLPPSRTGGDMDVTEFR